MTMESVANELAPLPEREGCDATTFREQILPAQRPVVIRGLVKDWPALRAGAASSAALGAYLSRFDKGAPVMSFIGPPSIGGKFWYSADMRGFNFERKQEPFGQSLARMLAHEHTPEPPALYMGSVSIAQAIPGFAAENRLDLLDAPRSTPRIWIGNATTVSTHFDLLENVACVLKGRRRFTLFPPEQVANLYVGPLEFNFAGPPVSMVSLQDPDFERYPRFREALDAAMTAELGPGDAIFIPYMWWHNIVALDAFNVLVNYWWNEAPAWALSPFDAMVYSMIALREMPAERREVWRKYFEHFVFQDNGDPVGHLAAEQRGIQGPQNRRLVDFVRQFLLGRLSP